MKICALVGNPVSHSASPKVFDAGFEKQNLFYRYIPFCVKNLSVAAEGLRALPVKGFSVTIPYKEKIIPLLDRVDPVARELGAVNTVVREGKKLIGYNTDWVGVYQPLRKYSLKGKKASVLGAGGAARAAVYALKKLGAKVTVFNRTFSRAQRLGKEFKVNSALLKDFPQYKSDIVINATSVGMESKKMSIKTKDIPTGGIVFDIVYTPKETALLKAARKKGCRVIYGTEMFLAQAAEQYKLWTGEEAPLGVIEKVLGS
ncbi:MAG TPA: shikimate dehydrogenase [Candidatus Peregrinibacteria bacterium]|nr:shikimate dehydrogenase [Candidatus Peregrinibacteria bacterium]